MANSAPLGLYCFPRHICPKTKERYSSYGTSLDPIIVAAILER